MPESKIKVTVGKTYIMRFTNADVRLDEAIAEFVKIGEAVAVRRIQMPKGILLLQMRPDDPGSGAVYVYDRGREEFHLLLFDGLDQDGLALTLQDFERLVPECNLLEYAEHPEWLQKPYKLYPANA